MNPTIVLVHGAFAESASWDPVVERLLGADQSVLAAANPLRGLASDAESVSDLVRSIDGPVLLVGHSYGGAVISNVDPGAGDIAGLVYVAAFAPDAGESANTLAKKFAGSSLGDALRPVPRSDGTTDLAIAPELFHQQFAADR
jgi:pimeloyl-ACP methyl ester carboxylesterase